MPTCPVITESDPAFLDVRAGDVDFNRIDRRVVKPARNLRYSATVEPETLAMKRVCEKSSLGRISLTTASTPGFCKPMAFSMPSVVQPGGGVIAQARSRVVPFRQIAPASRLENPYAGIFIAESDASGQQDQGGSKFQAAKIDLESVIVVHAWRPGFTSFHSCPCTAYPHRYPVHASSTFISRLNSSDTALSSAVSPFSTCHTCEQIGISTW